MRIDLLGLLRSPPPDKHVQMAADALERHERGDTANALQVMDLALRIGGVQVDRLDALQEIAEGAKHYAGQFGNTLQWLEDHGKRVDTGPINRVAAATDFFERRTHGDLAVD